MSGKDKEALVLRVCAGIAVLWGMYLLYAGFMWFSNHPSMYETHQRSIAKGVLDILGALLLFRLSIQATKE